MNHQKTIEKLKQAGFSSERLKRLQNMQRGDENNKKGAFYERMFTFYRILQETENLLNAEQSPINSDILFSNAELAFVDDLCITFSEKKERYQLKNSPTAGKADKLHEVFDDQKRMDECLQQPAQSFLVCSDEKPLTIIMTMAELPANISRHIPPAWNMRVRWRNFCTASARTIASMIPH